jgi:hypothetical protein
MLCDFMASFNALSRILPLIPENRVSSSIALFHEMLFSVINDYKFEKNVYFKMNS